MMGVISLLPKVPSVPPSLLVPVSVPPRPLHFWAYRAPGAGACPTATPASRDTHVPSPLLRVALQRRCSVLRWWRRQGSSSQCGPQRRLLCSRRIHFRFPRTGEPPASCTRPDPLRAAHARIPVTPSAFSPCWWAPPCGHLGPRGSFGSR